VNIARMGMGWPFVALVAAAVSLQGDAPKQHAQATAHQQAKAAQQPASTKKEPPGSGSEKSGCPGTRAPQVSCDALTAEATMRQADIAADQTDLMRWGNWLGLLTTLVAGAAAYFAYSAASAGTKSYKAFVAAEDAHLAVEFPNGTLIESQVDGVRQPNSYHLTAKITNIGRSTARLKYCRVNAVDAEQLSVDETLKKDESTELGWRIMLESLEPFKLLINYASPIRTEAVLVVTAQPRTVHGIARVVADVIDTRLVDFGDIELGR
jgi:hypothetical protein